MLVFLHAQEVGGKKKTIRGKNYFQYTENSVKIITMFLLKTNSGVA
ncbi:hypothetical protein ACUW9N_000766 [Staphylococcus auricularis]